MKIVSLKFTKPKQDLVEVAFEGGPPLECDGEVAVRFRLAAGVELDAETLERLCAENDFVRGRKLAVAYVALRPKPSGAVRQYLRNKKFGQEAVARVLAHLEERGYVNDRDFGRRFLESRMRQRPVGVLKLIADLRGKGLAEALVEELVEPYRESETQLQAARAALAKKLRTLRAPDARKRREKAWRALAGLGFESEIIRGALDAQLAEDAFDDEPEKW